MGQVCFDSDNYYLFIFLLVGIIIWTLSKKKVIYRYKDCPSIESNPRVISRPQIQSVFAPESNFSQHSMPSMIGYNPTHSMPSIPLMPSMPLMPEIPAPRIIPSMVNDPSFLEIGYVQNKKGNNLNKMFKLYGRKYNDNKFDYYVVNDINNIKIPIYSKNNWELNTGDYVEIDGFRGKFIVKLYYN